MSRVLSESEIGEEIGEYIIVRVLSRNLLGSTFFCQHAITAKKVIIKTFPKDIQDEPGFMARFQLLCEQIVNFSHPNVLPTRLVALYEEQPYAVLDYLPSAKGAMPLSLHDILIEQGVLSEVQVYYLARQLSNVLSYAHHSNGGMVHSNLKPSNILFSGDGQPKLAEFGLLNLIGQSYWQEIIHRYEPHHSTDASVPSMSIYAFFKKDRDPSAHPNLYLTQDHHARNAIAETLAYMSPEQRAGGRVTERSNVYSLGMILYIALTGHLYHEGAPMPSTYGIPAYWDTLILRATQEDPLMRYPSADVMFADINRSHKYLPFIFYSFLMVVVLMLTVFLGWELPAYFFAHPQRSFTVSMGTPDLLDPLMTTALDVDTFLPRFKLPEPLPETFTPGSHFAIPKSAMVMLSLPVPVQLRGTAKISTALWLSQSEITQLDFLNLMEDDPSMIRSSSSRLPVNAVSYSEALEFCQRLTAREQEAKRIPIHYIYRLPTKTEWLIAYWAREPMSRFDRMRRACSAPSTSQNKLRVAGAYPPNRLGFYDMYDNLEEWILSPYDDQCCIIKEGADSALSIFTYPLETRESTIGFRIVLAPNDVQL